jgi:hypothetical protein
MLIWLSLVALLFTQTTATESFAIRASLPLTQPVHGIDGTLQLVQDARLTVAMQRKLWNTGETSTLTLRNAALRIVRRDNTIVDSIDFERPMARLAKVRLYGTPGRETFLVTVDFTAEAGSYNGPITYLVDVVGGHLKFLEATDRTTGKADRIALMQSLKRSWQLAPAQPGSPGTRDILYALSQPGDATATEFVTIYRRYFFDGTSWIRVSREEKGLTEFDGGPPSRRLFPSR